MSRVNQYFHTTVDLLLVPKAEREAFLHEAERWEKHNKVYSDNGLNKYKARDFRVLSDGYACFHCHRIRDKSAFSMNQTERRNAKSSNRHQHDGHMRFCIDCGLQLGNYRPGTFISTLLEKWYCRMANELDICQDLEILVVYPSCNSACQFEILSTHEVCQKCISVGVDCSWLPEQPQKLKEYVGTTVRIQCSGCSCTTELRTGQEYKRCPGCKRELCEQCSLLKDDGCRCDEPGLGSAFDHALTGKRNHHSKVEGLDVLELNETDVLTILNVIDVA